MTPERLAEIEAREKAATAAPWTREKPGICPQTGFREGVAVAATLGNQMIYAHPPGGQFPSADANFIAHARQDIPDLVAEVRRLRAALEQPK